MCVFRDLLVLLGREDFRDLLQLLAETAVGEAARQIHYAVLADGFISFARALLRAYVRVLSDPPTYFLIVRFGAWVVRFASHLCSRIVYLLVGGSDFFDRATRAIFVAATGALLVAVVHFLHGITH